MNNNEKDLKGIIENLMKCVGNTDLHKNPILVDLDKLEIKALSKDEVSDILGKHQVADEDEIIIDFLKDLYKNEDISFEDICKEKVEEEPKEAINPFESSVNAEIEDNVSVLIYMPYESKDDLFEKILELIDIFGEDIINDLFVEVDEKLIKVEIFRQITQNEIFNLLSAFGDKNTRVNVAGDSLWIIVDDCI